MRSSPCSDGSILGSARCWWSGTGRGCRTPRLALAGPQSDPDALDAVRGGFPTSALAVIDVPTTWEELDPGTTSLRLFHVPRE